MIKLLLTNFPKWRHLTFNPEICFKGTKLYGFKFTFNLIYDLIVHEILPLKCSMIMNKSMFKFSKMVQSISFD